MKHPLVSCLLIAVGALSLAACETPAGKVSVLSSGSAAVQPGSTYAWAPPPTGSGDPRIDNTIIRDRLKSAIDTNLAAKGYRLVGDPAAAALIVRYHVGLQNKSETQVDTFGGGPAMACGVRGCVGGYGWGLYGPPSVDVRTIDYVQGTLMLDLYDRASQQLAWRATSDKRVDEKDASPDRLNAIIADMLKSLPGAVAS